jgi:hypothetical protein
MVVTGVFWGAFENERRMGMAGCGMAMAEDSLFAPQQLTNAQLRPRPGEGVLGIFCVRIVFFTFESFVVEWAKPDKQGCLRMGISPRAIDPDATINCRW